MAGGSITSDYPKSNGEQGKSVIVPTIVQISQDMIDYFANMTCLYNRYHYPTEKVTLPICMFHVKKITETWQNNISSKRILLYEPEESTTPKELSDPIRKGVMEVFADNIVNDTFVGCADLKQITQPKSIEMLAPQAFRNCTELTTVKLLSHLIKYVWTDPNDGYKVEEDDYPDIFVGCPKLSLADRKAIEDFRLYGKILHLIHFLSKEVLIN
jgi:hypothetical protein